VTLDYASYAMSGWSDAETEAASREFPDSPAVREAIGGFGSEWALDATIGQVQRAIGSIEANDITSARSAAKRLVSSVGMHLASDVRHQILVQLDRLLDEEVWDPDDTILTVDTFASFLRSLFIIKPYNLPGIAVSGRGNLIAVWKVSDDRLTIEFSVGDTVNWVVTVLTSSGPERAAGTVPMARLLAVLQPYDPDRWLA
jgi:hypothetical protein